MPSVCQVVLPTIAEYSDKTPHLSHWGEGCRRRGEGVFSIEEKHKKGHYNLQTSLVKWVGQENAKPSETLFVTTDRFNSSDPTATSMFQILSTC
jgi:hypothetical protein